MKKVSLLLILVAITLIQSPSLAYSGPAAPTLESPPAGARIAGFGPTLTWLAPQDEQTTQVHLQVFPVAGDGPGIDLILSTAEPRFTIPAPPGWFGLLPDMRYSWQVRLSDAVVAVGPEDDSWGEWSQQWTFRTPPISASSILAVSPRLNTKTDSVTPTLVWSDTNANAWYYEIQVSRAESFGPDAFLYWELRHGGVTSPPRSYAIPPQFPLEPGRQYYWRVRPRVQGDGSSVHWTKSFSFTTPDIATPLAPTPTPVGNRVSAQVTAIVNGSTIEVLLGGERHQVSYLGISTPQVAPAECYGAQAATKNSELVEGQIVQLETDITDADAQGRLLRYVYVDDVFVNAVLLAQGFARATVAPPDAKYQELFRAEEAAAREANLGLWNDCAEQ